MLDVISKIKHLCQPSGRHSILLWLISAMFTKSLYRTKILYQLNIFILGSFSGYPLFAQEVEVHEQSPAPMIYHNLVYHELAKKVLLFGGNS